MPNLVGWFGYCVLQYSSNAHWDFSWRLSICATSDKPHASEIIQNSTFNNIYQFYALLLVDCGIFKSAKIRGDTISNWILSLNIVLNS